MIDSSKTSEIEAKAFRQLEFAVTDCRKIDWENCREGDRMNFLEDLFSFMHPKLGSIDSATKAKWEKGIRSIVPMIRKAFESDFNALADGQAHFEIKIPAASNIEIFAFATDRFGPYRQTVTLGDDVQTARVHLQNYLVESRITPSQIRRCPQCKDAIFLLKKKPQRPSPTESKELKEYYCSPRCSTKAATIAYRARLRKKSRRTPAKHSRHRREFAR